MTRNLYFCSPCFGVWEPKLVSAGQILFRGSGQIKDKAAPAQQSEGAEGSSEGAHKAEEVSENLFDSGFTLKSPQINPRFNTHRNFFLSVVDSSHQKTFAVISVRFQAKNKGWRRDVGIDFPSFDAQSLCKAGKSPGSLPTSPDPTRTPHFPFRNYCTVPKGEGAPGPPRLQRSQL